MASSLGFEGGLATVFVLLASVSALAEAVLGHIAARWFQCSNGNAEEFDTSVYL